MKHIGGIDKMIDWENKNKDWKEQYPRVMKWEDVPEERRVTPEFILNFRGDDYGKQEAEGLESRTCIMAVDYGSRWGKRFGMYARCGNKPVPNENLCWQHGGPKVNRNKLRKRQEKLLMKAKEDLDNSIAYYSQIISRAREELQYSKEQINKMEQISKAK